MNSSVLKYILVLAITFGVAFGYFKFIVSPVYTSTVVLYPTSTLNPQFLLEAGLRFGDEKELNELLEVLKSNDVAIKVIEQIKQSNQCSYCVDNISESIKLLEKHVKVERSLNRSAMVIVEDESAVAAAYIANKYASVAYEHLSKMVSDRLQSHMDVELQMFKTKQSEVKVLKDTLEKLEALGERKVSGIIVLESPRYKVLNLQLDLEIRQLEKLKHQTEHLQGLIEKGMPRFFVVSKATPSEEISIIKMLLYSMLFAIFSTLSFAVYINRTLFFSFANKTS